MSDAVLVALITCLVNAAVTIVLRAMSHIEHRRTEKKVNRLLNGNHEPE